LTQEQPLREAAKEKGGTCRINRKDEPSMTLAKNNPKWQKALHGFSGGYNHMI
jgi:hypothetical protein